MSVPPPRLARLDRRALVAVNGPDARSFLQGLLTQDVDSLGADGLRYGALLSPQGRLLFDVFIYGAPDGVVLDVEAARRDAFIQRLSIYRLRAKVEVGPAEGSVFALWGQAAAAAPWRPDPRLPALGFRAHALEAPSTAGAETASQADYDRHRLSLGAPDPDLDCAGETAYPIEADLDLLGGIDFKKGCYVGQETTSRVKRRGQIKARMLPIDFEGAAPPPGAEVLADGSLRAGEVRSGLDGRAMALLRLDRIRDASLSVEGRAVRVSPPTWVEISES